MLIVEQAFRDKNKCISKYNRLVKRLTQLVDFYKSIGVESEAEDLLDIFEEFEIEYTYENDTTESA